MGYDIDMNDYLTTSEVAALLDLTARRVRQLAPQLGGVELVPGRLLFPRAAVERFRASPRAKPGYPKGRPRKPPADLLPPLG